MCKNIQAWLQMEKLFLFTLKNEVLFSGFLIRKCLESSQQLEGMVMI